MIRRAAIGALVAGSLVVPAIPAAAASSGGKPAFCANAHAYPGLMAQVGNPHSVASSYFATMQATAPRSVKKDVRVVVNAAKTYAVKHDFKLFTSNAVITAEKHIGTYISKHCL